MSRSEALDLLEEGVEERLAKALEILAGIVAEHGEQRRPLHDQLRAQLDEIRVRNKARACVRRLSGTGEPVVDPN